MKIIRLNVAVLLSGWVMALAADAPAKKPELATLAWLAGSWTFERNGKVVEEQWLAPAGGTMVGMGRTVANGKTIEHEFLLLHEDASGEILYTAKPSGQPEASFKLVRASDVEVVFENPAHDFPQRIKYNLQPDGSLLAAIEGETEGKARRVVFPYRRTKA
jgi:hypothetical protein